MADLKKPKKKMSDSEIHKRNIKDFLTLINATAKPLQAARGMSLNEEKIKNVDKSSSEIWFIISRNILERSLEASVKRRFKDKKISPAKIRENVVKKIKAYSESLAKIKIESLNLDKRLKDAKLEAYSEVIKSTISVIIKNEIEEEAKFKESSLGSKSIEEAAKAKDASKKLDSISAGNAKKTTKPAQNKKPAGKKNIAKIKV